MYEPRSSSFRRGKYQFYAVDLIVALGTATIVFRLGRSIVDHEAKGRWGKIIVPSLLLGSSLERERYSPAQRGG